jgi:hypothetical protein
MPDDREEAGRGEGGPVSSYRPQQAQPHGTSSPAPLGAEARETRSGIGRWKALLVAIVTVGAVCGILPADTAYGQQTEEMKRMQQQLNEQVMSKPFSVPDEAQVKAYIEDAQKKGVVPGPYTGRYWRPGYTCYDLARYSHGEYLSCRHYYHHYGYYYRWR